MKMVKLINCWFLFFVVLNGLNALNAETQDTITKKNNFVYSASFQSGRVQSSNPFLKNLNTTSEELGEYQSFGFNVLKQTTGKKLWEQNYNYPRYGVGINLSRFFNNNYLSTPIAIHGAYEQAFKRWNKLSLNYDAGFGLTLNWESFNKAEKNYNISIGAAVTSYINAGIFLSYEISPHFDLGLGYGLTHYSNGAMKIPNFGLNTMAPKISLEYVFNRFDPPKTKFFVPPFSKNTSIELSVDGGEKNVVYPEADLDTATSFNGIYYPVFGLNAVLYRQISYKSKIGIGLTVGYDGSKNAVVSVKNGNPHPDQSLRQENVLLSIYPSYELVFNKISLYAQPSFYLIKNQTTYERPTFFTRVGVKYWLSDRWNTSIGLHSYKVHKADFLEWTIGYQIPVSKK